MILYVLFLWEYLHCLSKKIRDFLTSFYVVDETFLKRSPFWCPRIWEARDCCDVVYQCVSYFYGGVGQMVRFLHFHTYIGAQLTEQLGPLVAIQPHDLAERKVEPSFVCIHVQLGMEIFPPFTRRGGRCCFAQDWWLPSPRLKNREQLFYTGIIYMQVNKVLMLNCCCC